MAEPTDSPSVSPAQTLDLTFSELQATNRQRCETAFHQVDAWKPWDWSNAIAGEVGEACAEGLTLLAAIAARSGAVCNLTKKMARVWPANEFKQNWNTPEDQRISDLEAKLANELADVVIYADLLATRIGRSLGDCVREKFNSKSDEIGSPVMLGLRAPSRATPEDGVSLIAAERRRQMTMEDWTEAHDDTHRKGEMARAAACYALQHTTVSGRAIRWPWAKSWWKPKTPIRDLVRAGALLAAEIDRLRRSASRATSAPEEGTKP